MSKETILTAITIIVFIGIVILWVNGLTKMHNDHPDYKGKDLFNEDEEDENI